MKIGYTQHTCYIILLYLWCHLHAICIPHGYEGNLAKLDIFLLSFAGIPRRFDTFFCDAPFQKSNMCRRTGNDVCVYIYRG